MQRTASASADRGTGHHQGECMELVGFFVVFLVCMGIAKAINAMRGRLTVNGAGIFLALVAVFIAWNVFMAWQSSLPAYELGYALGRNVGPALIVGAVAVYYFFSFRTEKAHQRHVQQLREKRAAEQQA
ncbi:hypothetical protein [Pseudoxanthomonas mexicana]|uniref:hypothetical protein n=1 Tax=Pseudoxanthomonas mexicana TaxID=128785 RepID=UPI0012ED8B1F|nr:hypothetical protein [Pseudoxanthomonas mexicana]